MTTPSEPDNGEPAEGVNLGKGEPSGDAPPDPAGEAPFDPYRFGKPDHPIPAEYAPPGYTGPVAPPPSPYPEPGPWAAPPGSQPTNPFSNPPGTPYGTPYGPSGPSGPAQPPYQYPPGQYGPPPPQYHGYVQPKTGNGKAVAALVLGIASVVFFWLSLFDGLFVVLGLVFSLIAMGETKMPGARGRGMAVAGLICSIIGAILATVFTVWAIHVANQCGGIDNKDSPGWNDCIRHHLS
jgi:hypothetical protein